MKNKLLLTTIVIMLIAMNSFAQVTGTFTDARDSKIYKIVTIGTQTWMAENLAFKADSGCWAYNDSISYVAQFGYLYNWKTAKTVCPSGWHLPTEAEWTILISYLGGNDTAGGKLKSTSNWYGPNTGATNSSGFSALPGGYRDSYGRFDPSTPVGRSEGNWWSSSEDDKSYAWGRALSYSYSNVLRINSSKIHGYSVRCLKDK